MTAATQRAVAAPHPAVATAYLAPEAVLYDERTSRVYRLNPAASAVWMLLDGTSDDRAIAADISDIFGLPVDEVTPGVVTALEQFAAQGLLLVDDVAEEVVERGPAIEVPDSVRPMLDQPPVDGEVAVTLAVYTRAGRAVLVHAAADALEDGGLAQAGVVRTEPGWVFVAPDGASVSSGDLRWPLLGVLVAGDEVDLDEARRRLWPLGRGNRQAWEALLTAETWVTPVGGDANEAVEAALA